MSPLWLLSLLQAALALNTASLSETEVTEFAWETDAAVPTVPAEVADLEAAVAAMYNGPPAPSSLNVRKLEETPEGVPAISKVEVPPEVAELEAAVLAKYSAPSEAKQPSSLNVRKLDESAADAWPVEGVEVTAVQPSSLNVRKLDKPTAIHSAPVGEFAWEATATASPEVAQQSSLNVRKLSAADSWPVEGVEVTAVQPSSLNVRKLEESAADAWPVEGVEVSAVQPSSLNVRKLDKPTAIHSAPVGEFAWEATPTASPEVAQQSSLNVRKLDQSAADSWPVEGVEVTAVQPSSLNVRKLDQSAADAWPVEGVEATPVQPSSLNVRKLDKPTAIHSAPVGEFAWEATPTASPEVAQQSSLNVRKLHEPVPIHSAPVGDFAWESAAAASPEATASQGSSLNVRRAKEVPQAEVPLTSPAKFTLKKPLKEVTPEDREENPSQPSLLDPFSPPVKEETARKSKKMVMHDMPHYRNHGAAMYHVEPATRKSTSSSTAEQDAAAKISAEQLAEKRAEVEDVFHLSKSDVELEPASETSAGTGRKLLRFVFLCAALLSIAGVAYHKYEVICQLSAGKGGLQKFKAKNEDMDMGGFAEPPRSAQHASEGFLTTMVANGRSSLSRRGGGQSRNSLPLPF